jgi:integrase/recombinase XerC
VEAYARDVEQFLVFLTLHLGGAPDVADVAGLRVADIRAFMATRREDGAGSRTLARGISGIRSLIRFLERDGSVNGAAFRAVRPPRQKRTLPRPLSPEAALKVADPDESLDEEPWIAARNAAVFALLYGCGLRISEALGLNRGEAPRSAADALRITGKGGKQRIVPVLPVVVAAVEGYLHLCPWHPGPAGPLFVGARGDRLNPRIVQRQPAPPSAAADGDAARARHSFATHLYGGGDLRTIQEPRPRQPRPPRLHRGRHDWLMAAHTAVHPRA